MTGFKFNVEDSGVFLSHLALQDADAAKQIAETPQWSENQVMTAEVKINGVPVPAKVFEEVMQHWIKETERQIEEQTGFLKLATAVETAAHDLLDQKAEGLLQKMREVENALDGLYVEMRER